MALHVFEEKQLLSPVNKFPSNTPFKESATSIAGQNAVVFSTGGIPAHNTRQSRGPPLHGPTVTDRMVRVHQIRRGR